MRPKSAPEPGFRKTPMFSGVRFCGRALIIDLKEVSREIVLPRTFFNIADAIQYTGPVTAVGCLVHAFHPERVRRPTKGDSRDCDCPDQGQAREKITAWHSTIGVVNRLLQICSS